MKFEVAGETCGCFGIGLVLVRLDELAHLLVNRAGCENFNRIRDPFHSLGLTLETITDCRFGAHGFGISFLGRPPFLPFAADALAFLGVRIEPSARAASLMG